MDTLVFVEHHDGEPTKASLGVLSKARALWSEVAAVVCGSGLSGLIPVVGAHGASTVYTADDAALAEPLPQPRVDVLAGLVEQGGFGTVLFGSSVLAADIAAGLAARLEGGLNWGLVDLRLDGDDLVGTQPALQDSVYVEVGWSTAPRIALLRSGAFEPVESEGTPAVEPVAVDVAGWSSAARMVERAHAESEGPSIEEAEIIVGGGRGLGGPENFVLVEELAQALGGAVGATRAVVDAGWYPYSTQVGQTGKTVAPKLYVACGISGAIQHKVGMQGSGTIVAINKDRNAPIFDYCDLGVVGDLHQILPKLTELSPGSQGLVTVRPADYPPPVEPGEFVAAPTDPPDERIDVGILIVGGGPAGLAAAIRAGQLLEERPELAERLGDVPIAVVEKGKAPGSHVLSGAVVDPRGLKLLFPGMRADDFPFYGPVEHEAVYYLTSRRGIRIPPPPSMLNHGNYIASMSRLSRWLAERAEELGVTIVPETAATRLLVSGGRVVGIRTGDRGRGRDGEELATFEPGSDIVSRVTILAEGTLGHLTRAAVEHYDLAGESPQVYALGVKEVWEVPKPLRRIVHTVGWPLRGGKRWREFGGSFIYPMGDELVALGLVVGLDHGDASLSVHDLLQGLKLHPVVRPIVEGGTRVGWGAKTIPEGGLQALPKQLHFPGGMIVGDAAGFVNVPALKGIHYAIRSGMLAAESAVDGVAPGSTAWTPGELASYDEAIRASFIWHDLKKVRNMRPAFTRGFVAGSAVAGAATASFGRLPPGDLALHADAEAPVSAGKERSYPAADGALTFDKLSSVFQSGNQTRDDAPDHIRVRREVPRELAETWVAMCPAQVYEIVGDPGDNGLVHVEVTASNCVQCGAITARGGRLTVPEGGDGPDYTLM